MSATATIPKDELHDLIRTARAGDLAARNRVVMGNMRLVTKIAAPMARRAGLVAQLDDIIQTGVIGLSGRGGLIRAIERFDVDRGKRFSTFATYWIRLAVRDAINEALGGMLRGGAQQRAAWVRSVADQLEKELERKPLQREIQARCVMLGKDAPAASTVDAANRGPNATFVDSATLPDSDNPEENAAMRELAEKALAVLSPTERRALELHAQPGEPWTDQQIGDELGLSRRRAGELVESALRKVRAMMSLHGGARFFSRSESGSKPVSSRRRLGAAKV